MVGRAGLFRIRYSGGYVTSNTLYELRCKRATAKVLVCTIVINTSICTDLVSGNAQQATLADKTIRISPMDDRQPVAGNGVETHQSYLS